MHFSLQLPTDKVAAPDEFITADALGEIARCAEQAGFAACFVTAHPMPSDRWLAHGGHHTLDPFVALSFAAAATTRIRLQTHIVVLPYRNPFLTAKSAASLDVLSGGRLILGVAAGYLRGEFAALGADVDERNEQTDEAIDALLRAWSESGVELEGRHFHAGGNTMLPRPLQQPHPPIWVGGNSRRAIRRAVEKGDGWLPFPAPKRLASTARTAALESVDELAERLQYAHEHARAVGRTRPLEVCTAPFSLASWTRDGNATRLCEEVTALAALGVGWLTISLAAPNRVIVDPS